MLSIALGIILGTLLTWLVTYFVIKKYTGKLVKTFMDNVEVKAMIESLKKKLKE